MSGTESAVCGMGFRRRAVKFGSRRGGCRLAPLSGGVGEAGLRTRCPQCDAWYRPSVCSYALSDLVQTQRVQLCSAQYIPSICTYAMSGTDLPYATVGVRSLPGGVACGCGHPEMQARVSCYLHHA
eukprot:883253-Rhodomonas_salina.1